MVPYLPDFAKAADALLLAQQMRAIAHCESDYFLVEYDGSEDRESRLLVTGKTLGEALLAALAEGE